MNTRQKIQIDRYAGLPLIFLLNGITRILGKILNRNHNLDPKSVRTIVVAKFVGMGSILQATPTINIFKEHFSHARLILLTQDANRPLVELLPNIDEIVYINGKNLLTVLITTITAISKLIRRRIDLYFDLEVYSAYAALMSLFSMARNRFGFYRHSAEFKKGIYTHLMYMNTRQPIRYIYMQLAYMAGAGAVPDKNLENLGPISLKTDSFETLKTKLSPLGWEAGKDYIVINPNASDLLLERRWPMGHFIELIERLTAENQTVVLIGSKEECHYSKKIISKLSPVAADKTVDSSGLLSISELLALLQRASCVITNDTGPMHMAIAMNAPTVCLFGPVHPQHYGYTRPNVRVIYRQVFCSPCLHEIENPVCNGNNICMQLITSDMVMAAVKSLNNDDNEKKFPGWTSEAHLEPYFNFNDRPLGMVTAYSVPEPVTDVCFICHEKRFIYLFEKDGERFWRCSKCRLERIYPLPETERIINIYNENYYDAWGLKEGEASIKEMKMDYFQRLLQPLLKELPQGSKMLDCGAATGVFMEAASKNGLEPYGVELSSFGASRIADRFGKDRIFQGTFEQAAFAKDENLFDGIFMSDFLEHVPNPEKVLLKAHRLLKDEKLLVICTPNTGSLSCKIMGRHWTHYKSEHLYYFNAANLEKLLIKTGFHVEYSEPVIKTMNLYYLSEQLKTYPLPYISKLFTGITALIPEKLQKSLFRISLGERHFVCRKVKNNG